MGVAERVETVRRVVEEGFNQGIADVASRCAPDFVNHVCVYGVPIGPAGLTEHIELVRRAYPDLHIVVTDAVADASTVAIRWDSYGTAAGSYMGLDASGRAFKSAQIAFYAFRDDELVEWTGNFDSLSIYRSVVHGEAPPADRQPQDPAVWTRAASAGAGEVGEASGTVVRGLVDGWLGERDAPVSSLAGLSASSRLDVAGILLPDGLDGFEQRRRQLHEAFAPSAVTVERMVAGDGIVAVRWRLEGRHVGPYLGIRATGRPVRLVSSAIARLDDGALVDWREIFDDEGFLDQTRTRYLLEQR